MPDDIYTPEPVVATPLSVAAEPAPQAVSEVDLGGDPYELVRVQAPDGTEFTATRAHVAGADVTVTGKPAVDVRGVALPTLTVEDRLAALEETASGLFDPDAHTVDEVVEHLTTADLAEVERVRQAEAQGRGRVTITRWAPAQATDVQED